VFRVEFSQLANCSYPRGVVGRDRGTFEALVKDARTETEAFGVVGGVEDVALDLRLLACLVQIYGHDPFHTLMRARTRCRGTAIATAMLATAIAAKD